MQRVEKITQIFWRARKKHSFASFIANFHFGTPCCWYKAFEGRKSLTESRGRCTFTISIFNKSAKRYCRNKHTYVRYCSECETQRSMEPKLSLLWDKSSVRYECLQIQWFYIFIRFQVFYVTCHLKASISLNLSFFIASQRPLVDLQCHALLFEL